MSKPLRGTSSQLCKFFISGKGCKKVDRCEFRHPIICKFYNTTGRCRNGNACRFFHPPQHHTRHVSRKPITFSVEVPFLVYKDCDYFMDWAKFTRETLWSKDGGSGTIRRYSRSYDLDAEPGKGERNDELRGQRFNHSREKLRAGWRYLLEFISKCLLARRLDMFPHEIRELIYFTCLRSYEPLEINDISSSFEEDI